MSTLVDRGGESILVLDSHSGDLELDTGPAQVSSHVGRAWNEVTSDLIYLPWHRWAQLWL